MTSCPRCNLRSLVRIEPGVIGCLLCAWRQEVRVTRHREPQHCEACGEPARERFLCVNPSTGQKRWVCAYCEETWTALRQVTVAERASARRAIRERMEVR